MSKKTPGDITVEKMKEYLYLLLRIKDFYLYENGWNPTLTSDLLVLQYQELGIFDNCLFQSDIFTTFKGARESTD